MNSDKLKKLYTDMLRIRRIEEAVAERYPQKKMRCPVHLSIGQEAVPVGIGAHLTTQDKVYSTHRCHAHYLAKGGNLNAMIAELYGKVSGCCKGKGGSMHLVDRNVGMMGSSALVAASIPLAVGSALATQFEKKSNVVIAYFGDGATEEGLFYESLNFAALKKLPIIFACENNFYATYSHQSARQADTLIYKRAQAFGIPSLQVEGNHVLSVVDKANAAIQRARQGEGPTLIEFITYRFRDHVGPDYDHHIGYRTKAEVEFWESKCPIRHAEEILIAGGYLTSSEKDSIERKILEEIELAFAFAEQSPFPEPEEIFRDIYAEKEI
jgi:pyruvate dehydrogenase E1 component alpha subunit